MLRHRSFLRIMRPFRYSEFTMIVDAVDTYITNQYAMIPCYVIFPEY